MIILLSAVSNKDWSVGKNGNLMWNIPSDLKFFKQKTENNIIVMGRKTFDSIGRKKLPNRENIIISNRKAKMYSGMDATKNRVLSEKEKKIYIIGGNEIWKEFIPISDLACITKVKCELEGDVFFPRKELYENFNLVNEVSYNFKGDQYNYNIAYYKKI